MEGDRVDQERFGPGLVTVVVSDQGDMVQVIFPRDACVPVRPRPKVDRQAIGLCSEYPGISAARLSTPPANPTCSLPQFSPPRRDPRPGCRSTDLAVRPVTSPGHGAWASRRGIDDS